MDILIDKNISNEFRKLFIRKKVDISRIIQNLMILEIKRDEIIK